MTNYRRAPMRLKRPHVATLDEVAITREDDGAVIAYKDRTVRTTHVRLGPEVHRMTTGRSSTVSALASERRRRSSPTTSTSRWRFRQADLRSRILTGRSVDTAGRRPALRKTKDPIDAADPRRRP
jgi:hypothetical protein